MDAGTYIVYLSTSDTACLGVDGNWHGQLVTANTSNSSTTWLVEAIPGTPNVYMRHVQSQRFARFGHSDSIHVDPLQSSDKEFVIKLDDLGDGLVAINNHDRSYVMDANGNHPSVGANVSPWKWNRGDNQRWRFVSTDLT
jgi:hypothetical protein